MSEKRERRVTVVFYDEQIDRLEKVENALKGYPFFKVDTSEVIRKLVDDKYVQVADLPPFVEKMIEGRDA